MVKKLGLFAICTGLLTVAMVLLEERNTDKIKEQTKEHSVEISNSSDRSPVNDTAEEHLYDEPELNPQDLIQTIVRLSSEGQIEDIPYFAGKTFKREVNEKWGEPDRISMVEAVSYEAYDEYHATLGYMGELLIDIRAYPEQLHTIHFDDIQSVYGEPDEISHYKDKNTDQVILIYHLNEAYHLRWMMNKPNDIDPNPSVNYISVLNKKQQEIETLIQNMSLHERIGQMIFTGISGTTLTENTQILINDYHVGGIILYADNLKHPQQSVQLLNELKQENEDQPLPLFLGVDQEGGRVSRLPGELINLPTNQAIGMLHDADAAYQIGTLLGEELDAFGFNLNFSPVLDINNNPNNTVIGDRSFGTSPQLVSQLGIQKMKGIQSQNIVSVIKHFPGHGDTSVDSHFQLPVVNKSYNELKQLELIPFRNAISEGADMVMIAHILLPQLDEHFPASLSKTIITDVLRKDLGFKGVVISDDMTMKAIADNYEIGRAAVEMIKAGGDIFLIAHGYNHALDAIQAVEEAVKQGEISESRINDSVRRIIQLKHKYELTNETLPEIDINPLNASIQTVLDHFK